MHAQVLPSTQCLKDNLFFSVGLINMFFFLFIDCRCSRILGSSCLSLLIKKQKDITVPFDSKLKQQAIDHKMMDNTFNEF